MVRGCVLGALLLMIGASTAAQTRRPPFLADAPPGPRLETLHLQAEVDEVVRVTADGRAKVSVRVRPKPGMHVYAADVDGYVPFTVTVEPRPGVRAGAVSYPRSETYVFPPTGESSRAYMQPFTVVQALTIAPEVRTAIAAGRSTSVALTLRYQACDDTVCYRPASGTLAFELNR